MNESKTISSETKESNKPKESQMKNKPVYDMLSDHISRKSLKQRYINLWRSRYKQNDNILDGFIVSYIVGAIMILYSSYVLSTLSFLLASSSLFVLGSIVGAFLAGYIYEFDEFLGFHIGIFGSVPMILLYSSIILLYNPIALVYIMPILILNTIMCGIGAYIYTSIGHQYKQNKKTN